MALFELHYKREKKLKFSRRLADVHAHRLAVNVTLHSPLTNLLAAVNGWINMESPHTGTTVIAVSYNGGVVLGSDSRVSMGQYISNRASSKVTPLADDIWLLRSGSAADAQGISDYVRYWSEQHSMDSGREPTVLAVTNLVKQITYNNKFLQGALIVAGWDKRQGGQVFCIPIGGTVVQEKWAADGSGSIFLLGYMDSVFREDLTQQEAEDITIKALSLAMARDGSSGGMIRLVACSERGSSQRIVQGDHIEVSWDEKPQATPVPVGV